MLKRLKEFAIYLFLILLVGCSGKQSQSVNKSDTSGFKSITHSDSLTYQKMYSEGEKRRGFYAKIAADPLTARKVTEMKVGENNICITLYYQENRIYTVVYRILNLKNEMKFNSIFDFDEKNGCISNSIYNIHDSMTFTNAVFGDSLIRFDIRYKKINLDYYQKKEIIRSTKASLDSVMQFFPEFQYTFNWETYLTVE